MGFPRAKDLKNPRVVLGHPGVVLYQVQGVCPGTVGYALDEMSAISASGSQAAREVACLIVADHLNAAGIVQRVQTSQLGTDLPHYTEQVLWLVHLRDLHTNRRFRLAGAGLLLQFLAPFLQSVQIPNPNECFRQDR